MKLPVARPISSTVDGVNGFTGLNHNLKIGNTEFYDQKNISSEKLPVVTQRKRRGILRTLTKANGLFAINKLGWIDGTQLYYDGVVVGEVSDSEKTIIRMGAIALIWPDKKYYNTVSNEFGSLEAYYTSESTVTAALSKADGTVYAGYTISNTAPTNPSDGDYWLDTSDIKNVLKQYSASMSIWTSIATVYVKISSVGIGEKFSEYDGVTISGMDNSELNGKFYIVSKSDDWIVVIAIIHEAITSNTTPVSVSRVIPEMEYLTECNNRVWGCNSANNEIYACTLGDPRNWNQFMGLATDSYAMSLGSAGAFTGAVTHLGTVMFFKSNMIHQISGSRPSQFTSSDTGARGVATGSAKSICVVSEVLYYLGNADVCSLAQSMPTSISSELGIFDFSDGVAGTCDNKYYICMKNSAGVHSVYVYDPESKVWSKEDNVNIKYFSSHERELYFIAGNTLYSVNGTLEYGNDDASLESTVDWMVETGDIGADTPYNKYISGIRLVVNLGLNSFIKAEIQYDAGGSWLEVFRTSGYGTGAITIPITTRRCRSIKLRLSGTGEVYLHSIVKRTSAGSDKNEI